MGRFAIGAGLLAALLAAGLWSQSRMERIQEPVAQLMEEASWRAMAGDMQGARQSAEAARAAWKENWVFTAALADHQPLEDIECLMVQLTAWENEQDGTYAALCAELARRIRAVAEAHELSAASLF